MRRAVIEPPVELSRRWRDKETHSCDHPQIAFLDPNSSMQLFHHKMTYIGLDQSRDSLWPLAPFWSFLSCLQKNNLVCFQAPPPPGEILSSADGEVLIPTHISHLTKPINYSRWINFPAPTEAINLHFFIINLGSREAHVNNVSAVWFDWIWKQSECRKKSVFLIIGHKLSINTLSTDSMRTLLLCRDHLDRFTSLFLLIYLSYEISFSLTRAFLLSMIVIAIIAIYLC